MTTSAALWMALAMLSAPTMPAEVEYEQVLEATSVFGLRVQSWHILTGDEALVTWTAQLPCATLPFVRDELWQCLAADRIYSWDRSVYPSLWSESQWLTKPGWEAETAQVMRFGTIEMRHWQERAPLYQVFRRQLNGIAEREGTILLQQEFVGAFVLYWRNAREEHAVVAWREASGLVLVTQVGL